MQNAQKLARHPELDRPAVIEAWTVTGSTALLLVNKQTSAQVSGTARRQGQVASRHEWAALCPGSSLGDLGSIIFGLGTNAV